MEIIDLNTWDRATHFNFFRRMDYPQYLICKNIDITNFLKRLKEREISFYYGMIYAATYALNQKEFKYRIVNDQVVLYDTIHPSYTDMSKDSDLFKMVTVDMEDDITLKLLLKRQK